MSRQGTQNLSPERQRISPERLSRLAGHGRPFLTAQWRWLVMLSWPIDARVLEPLVPAGCELDRHAGETFVSIVGFMFFDTRVWGMPIPWHRDFPEVNLRFYVRRRLGDEVRRGVVFIKEIVPRRAISLIARYRYNENYTTLAMRHTCPSADAQLHPGERISYGWRQGKRWNDLSAVAGDSSSPAVEGSIDQFITEHYWGYTRQRDGSTSEYLVDHPPWRITASVDSQFDCEIADLYGQQFAGCARPPTSALIADGSPIAVYPGQRLNRRSS